MVGRQTTTSQHIYDDLRTRLVSTGFAHGQRMKSDDLRKDYACSASTIREVLFRLSCDNFLVFEDQKGFRVPTASHHDLQELATIRVLLEKEGVTASIRSGGLTWEARLTAAHHKLAHIEHQIEQLSNLRDFVTIWTAAEREFHETLVSASPSTLLKTMHRTTFDRYRQTQVGLCTRGKFGFREGNISEHAAILDAALAKDIDMCCELVEYHIRASMTDPRKPVDIENNPFLRSESRDRAKIRSE